MDPALYKDIQVKRGYTYHYYHTLPTDADKPTLLFIHGFPSTSYDWRRQAAHFANAGYGVLVPDMLGYGGSSKPTHPADYRNALVAKDVVEIVDAERLTNVVAVGHDWYARSTGTPHILVPSLTSIQLSHTGALSSCREWPTSSPTGSSASHGSPCPTPRLRWSRSTYRRS